MEKKRSVGVIVFGIIGIIIGLVVLDRFSRAIRATINQANHQISLRYFLFFLLYPIVGISFIVSGISILQLRHWARKLFLSLMVIYSFLGLFVTYVLIIVSLPGSLINYLFLSIFYGGAYLIFFLLPTILSFVFFTRPKVKDQFR